MDDKESNATQYLAMGQNSIETTTTQRHQHSVCSATLDCGIKQNLVFAACKTCGTTLKSNCSYHGFPNKINDAKQHFRGTTRSCIDL